MKRRCFIRLLCAAPVGVAAGALAADAAVISPFARRVTIRHGLPPVAWRSINAGVSPIKPGHVQYVTATEITKRNLAAAARLTATHDEYRESIARTVAELLRRNPILSDSVHKL